MHDKRLLRDLTTVLAAERAAILGGSYDKLADLGQRKTALFADLATAQPDASTLQRIGQDVARNQSLLRAAIAGMRDAGARLVALRAAMDGFQAYGREGQREMVTSARPGLERKF